MADAFDPVMARLAIEDECAAANQLLLASIRSLHRLRSVGYDEYVLTATLAAGAEKLVKLTLGFIREDVEGGGWPSDELRLHGHDISALDEACRGLLASRTSRTPWVAVLGASERLRDDAHIAGILRLVTDYARGGRFYNLDYLGGNQRGRTSVREQWLRLINDVEVHSLRRRRHVVESRIIHPGTPGGWGSAHSLRASVEVWRDYYLTVWQHGLCGPRAQDLAENISYMGVDIELH